MPKQFSALFIFALASITLPSASSAEDNFQFSHGLIVTRKDAPMVVQTAATVLKEEIRKRSPFDLKIGHNWQSNGWSIAIVTAKDSVIDGMHVPGGMTKAPESFAIKTDKSQPTRPKLWIIGSDPRGALFGAGWLLRNLHMTVKGISLSGPLNMQSSPQMTIRGHQLGYRATANSYDAWSPAQFEQYIRELAIFGCNSVEGIPFQDTRPTVNLYPRAKMNIDLSRICQKYGQDYWIWVPADFDLRDAKLRAEALQKHEDLFRDCPELTGVFVPGGDPGDNPPELVIPYLADLAELLAKYHKTAKVWLSMQGYKPVQQDFVYNWIIKDRPPWLGGLVGGPSSPPLNIIRSRLPKQYMLRDYPDITHNTRSQFGIPWWDPAFAMTLGRESVNPRPLFFQRVICDTAPFTNGFISYSDGVHDDVNKIVWSALAWNRDASILDVLTEYCRFFFGEDYSLIVNEMLGLETNWRGSIRTSDRITKNYGYWEDLERSSSQLRLNWRWQMGLLRAYYDEYSRRRVLREEQVEKSVYENLLHADFASISNAVEQSLTILNRTSTEPKITSLRTRIISLCDELYKSIGLQTSVEKYHASGAERGAILDFIDYPLNNRYWLEDELTKVLKLTDKHVQIARLREIATWEHPGDGSYYDAIGHVGKSPHEVRDVNIKGPLLDFDNSVPTGMMFWIGNNPLARVRQTWMSYETWPKAIEYPPVSPNLDYIVKTTGYGECLLRVNGVRVTPTVYGKGVGEIKLFPIPRELYKDGNITLTFDVPNEPGVNWREQSRLTEVWLIYISKARRL